MFTGLVSEIGKVAALERNDAGARLRIDAQVATDAAPGDSIAVDGACLTAVDPGPGGFSADVMNATLERTTLGSLREGSPVNLEPALMATARLGGHLVQGHVDGVAVVAQVREDGFARRIAFDLEPDLARYVAERGSIALSGVSLTVSALTESGFEVSLIPETLERTTLGSLELGGQVNVEVDVLARYAERLLAGQRDR